MVGCALSKGHRGRHQLGVDYDGVAHFAWNCSRRWPCDYSAGPAPLFSSPCELAHVSGVAPRGRGSLVTQADACGRAQNTRLFERHRPCSTASPHASGARSFHVHTARRRRTGLHSACHCCANRRQIWPVSKCPESLLSMLRPSAGRVRGAERHRPDPPSPRPRPLPAACQVVI